MSTAEATSPFAPAVFPTVAPVAGVTLAGLETGLKYQGRKDVLVASLARGTTVAGVLTRSKCPSAPVEWCRKALPRGKARALVVNAGNANAFTGQAGVDVVAATVAAAASVFHCKKKDVFVASTGVIGQPVPVEHLPNAVHQAPAQLSPTAWEDAAQAIMTTDTFAKAASRRVQIGDAMVTITGIAKGSGMIAPNMATMLASVFT